MDSDLNNFNEFLCGDESNHFPPTTQDRTSRKESLDVKPAEYLISPMSNHLGIKIFNMHSPTPIKQHFQLDYEDQSCSQDLSEMVGLKFEKRCINHVLNFGESPQRKSSNCNTPSKLTTDSKISKTNNDIGFREDKRNSKGLRNLSECVYKIVLNQKVTTYKEVADQLVEMLNEGSFGACREAESKGKDEQNIKRRVYDALNVLISANVLKKNGKYVLSEEEVFTEKIKFSKNSVCNRQSLNEQLRKKDILVKEKKDRITELKYKYEILQALIKRNRYSKSLKNKEMRISFPIIGIVFSDKIPKIERKDLNSTAIIPLNNIFQIVGDLDLLIKSGIDVFSQDIEEVIREESDEENSYGNAGKKKKRNKSSFKHERILAYEN